MLVEHYPDRQPRGAAAQYHDAFFSETFALVTFERWSPQLRWTSPRRGQVLSFATPDWQHTTRQQVEDLVGEPLDWPPAPAAYPKGSAHDHQQHHERWRQPGPHRRARRRRVVQGVNERGVHLVGEQEWRNWSRWVDKPAEPPRRGARVRLGLDTSGFLRQLEGLDQVVGADVGLRDRTITRLAVLKAAATFAAGKAQVTENVSSADVLKIAEHWLRWVEED